MDLEQKPMARLPSIHHSTSEPYRFFGRARELAVLNDALGDPAVSVVGLVGPGGQGKTAIAQEWLASLKTNPRRIDGLFFWSFYRGKDADLCLREMYGYAARLPGPPEVASSFCVDRLLPILRRETWVFILDGAEVVQHETGAWFGRFAHPELARLLEELATEPMPGVVVVTSRFPLPNLEKRRHARLIDLSTLDTASARELLRSLGVHGGEDELDEAVGAVGGHAKGVELLGSWLAHFRGGLASRSRELPEVAFQNETEESRVARVLLALRTALPQETGDLMALATAFRQPPTENQLVAYLASSPVRSLLEKTWKRTYAPWTDREPGWLEAQLQWLVDLRLLERVGGVGHQVIDAHPLVRRGFEHHLGEEGQRQGATARAGFLRGRPDRRPPQSLNEAREEVELFHAFCEAGLWNEADSAFVALDNPKHRFLAPAFERDLLLQFFPAGEWRQPPLWAGFGRWRSLAISLEMLGQFADALEIYRPEDAALRGDSLIALGRLSPILERESVAHPWQNLWRAYRCHALCLAGHGDRALAIARSLVPIDMYEWVHWFECLLRADALAECDPRGLAVGVSPGGATDWKELVRRRILADWQRICQPETGLDIEFRFLTTAFDQGGLPWERALVRLSHARWLLAKGRADASLVAAGGAIKLGRRYNMPIVLADALALTGHKDEAEHWRGLCGYKDNTRP
jgi:hypothetical protein